MFTPTKTSIHHVLVNNSSTDILTSVNMFLSDFLYKKMSLFIQAKKRQYDQEVENLEKKQKQTIERLEQDHTSRLRDEAKRIKADQDKELSKFQNMLKNRKKEVRSNLTISVGGKKRAFACGTHNVYYVVLFPWKWAALLCCLLLYVSK